MTLFIDKNIRIRIYTHNIQLMTTGLCRKSKYIYNPWVVLTLSTFFIHGLSINQLIPKKSNRSWIKNGLIMINHKL